MLALNPFPSCHWFFHLSLVSPAWCLPSSVGFAVSLRCNKTVCITSFPFNFVSIRLHSGFILLLRSYLLLDLGCYFRCCEGHIYLISAFPSFGFAITLRCTTTLRALTTFDRTVSEFVELLQPCLTSLTLCVLVKETSVFLVASPSLLVPLLPHCVVVTTYLKHDHISFLFSFTSIRLELSSTSFPFDFASFPFDSVLLRDRKSVV